MSLEVLVQVDFQCHILIVLFPKSFLKIRTFEQLVLTQLLKINKTLQSAIKILNFNTEVSKPEIISGFSKSCVYGQNTKYT